MWFCHPQMSGRLIETTDFSCDVVRDASNVDIVVLSNPGCVPGECMNLRSTQR